MKVLIAEDDKVSRLVVSAVLGKAGHEVVQAENGETAWRILQEPDAPRLALLDWMMPKMDGLEVLQKVRSNGPTRTDYVILLTGRVDTEDLVRGLEAGANDYLCKPFNQAELRARVQAGARLLELQGALAQRVGELETALEDIQRGEAERLLLTTAVEQAADAVVITDADGRIQYVSPAFTAMTGYSSPEVIGRNPRVLKSGKQDPKYYQELWKTILAGGAWRGELINRRKDGTLYTEEMAITPMRDSSGVVTGFMAVKHDVTERKQAEAALRASESRYRLLFENNVAAIVHTTLDGRIVDCNDSYARVLGYESPGEMLGLPVSDIYWDPEKRPAMMARLQAEKTLTGIEVKLRRKNGEPIWVIVNLSLSLPSDAGAAVIQSTLVDISERKRAEEALRHSEAYLAESQRMSHVGSWAWDVATQEIIYWSPEHYRIFGFDEGKGPVSFAAALERVHPDDRRSVGKFVNRVVRERKDFEWDFRLRLPDGSTKYIHGAGQPVLNERGEMVELLGTHMDVTERKRAEARLTLQYRTARSLAESETLAEAVPRVLESICEPLGWDYGIHWEADPQANVLRWAGSWHTPALDLTQAENAARELTLSPGRGMCGRVWETGQPLWFSDLASHQVDRGEVIEPNRLRSAVAFPITVGTKVLSTIQLFSRDVRPLDAQILELLMTVSGQIGPLIERQRAQDEKSRAEQALQRSEERARLLFATIPHPTYVFDLDTLDFLEVNHAALERYGYSREEFLRMKSTDISAAEEIQQFKAHLPGMASRNQSGRLWKHRAKDGCLIDVEMTHHIIDYDGRRALLVIAQDVTERKQLELELRHSQKLEAVGSLASGIAHEINTPIQFVGDNTHFLQDSFRDLATVLEKHRQVRDAAVGGAVPPGLLDELAQAEAAADMEYLQQEIPRALEQSLEGVGRVASIVRAMKEFAHPDRSEKMATDLNRALESTLIVARNEIKYVADTETDFGELPLVPCHGGDMNQVFLNLLVNAAHAIKDVVKDSGEKGLIQVRTRCEGREILISIADSGTGIPDSIREKIFEPFFTTKEVGRGTGQGLAIARSIVVDKHGGSLTFDTEVGQGTTFYIRLPVDPDAGLKGGGA